MFLINSYDGLSWSDGDQVWTSRKSVHTAGRIDNHDQTHFIDSQLPHHVSLRGKDHFDFGNPNQFNFRGDFTVTALFFVPAVNKPFHMFLSRRLNSDWTAHHQIFLDARNTGWVSKGSHHSQWQAGNYVAVLMLGGGSGKHTVWARTKVCI